MKKFAWAICALGLLVGVPADASAQSGSGEEIGLESNFPNPFNPETTIPFTLPESLWEEQEPIVSLRIYNVLAQLVAVAVLEPVGDPLNDLAVPWNGTGRFLAFWNGKILDTDREAASGVYVYQLVVNGSAVGSRKMTVVK
ncbi:MAG: hypothetical protein OEY63_07170 [Gemmatimonadota bacterium]|nr:hypothetical protein [Gemmatimonadota bacterium]